MKKLLILLISMLCVTVFAGGCGDQTDIPVETSSCGLQAPVNAQVEQPYSFCFAVPEQAMQQTALTDETGSVYTQAEGEYEIYTQTFQAASLYEAVKDVTGFPLDRVPYVKTEQFSMPRYDFAWSTNDEYGQRVCRAALYYDGAYYYCLVFSEPDTDVNANQDAREQVFSSLGLFFDEGI